MAEQVNDDVVVDDDPNGGSQDGAGNDGGAAGSGDDGSAAAAGEDGADGKDVKEVPVKTSLMGEPPPVKDTPLKDDKTEVKIDPRLLDKDGKFNEDGAKEILKEFGEKEENLNSRLNEMRKMVSTKDEFVEKKEQYFQDFAPQERFMKYFDEETPEETKEVMGKIQEKLSEKYFDVALNKKQAYEISNSILEVMEDVGLLDTRTDEQKVIDEGKRVKEQMELLGPNAENIVRETKEYVMNSPHFTAAVKNDLMKQMESGGASMINLVYQMKGAFGSSTGRIPTDVSTLSDLPPDTELVQQYLNAKTDVEKENIIAKRHAAGRPGLLMDALPA